MSKIRNIAIGAVAVAAPLILVAAPAGAAQSHPKYIKAIEKAAPGLKQYSKSSLTKVGVAICGDLNNGFSINAEATTLLNTNSKSGLSDKQDGVILAGAVIFICPSFEGALNAWDNAVTGNSGSETVSYVVPEGFAPYRILATVASGGTVLNPEVSA